MTGRVTTARAARSDRASTTQEAILTAAERLFAEHGVFAVSNRQVSEAAGQGNNEIGRASCRERVCMLV